MNKKLEPNKFYKLKDLAKHLKVSEDKLRSLLADRKSPGINFLRDDKEMITVLGSDFQKYALNEMKQAIKPVKK